MIDKEELLDGALQAIGNGFPFVLGQFGTKATAYRTPKVLNRLQAEFYMKRKKFNPLTKLGEEVRRGLYLMMLDADTPEAARLIEEHDLTSTAVVAARRGDHHFAVTDLVDVRNKINFLGSGLDLIFHGYTPLPPSWVEKTNCRYTWKSISHVHDLPLFPGQLLDLEPVKEIAVDSRDKLQGVIVSELPSTRKIDSARRALARRYSIAGEDGDMALFKAACLLIQFYRFDYSTAYQLLLEWNFDGHCQPPWPVGGHRDRLAYKLRQAQRLMK